jgi:hypothetical protein
MFYQTACCILILLSYLHYIKKECNCGPTVPPDIQRAVQEHLKRRRLEQPSVFESSQRFNIQQQRELIKREFGFSLWRIVLPRYHGSAGDPIVEYRNSHRILFVKKMSEVSTDKDTLRLNNNIRFLLNSYTLHEHSISECNNSIDRKGHNRISCRRKQSKACQLERKFVILFTIL